MSVGQNPLPVLDRQPRTAQVTAYAIDRLYHSLPAIILNLTLMPVVVGFVLWGQISHVLLGSWIAASFVRRARESAAMAHQ